MKQSRINASKMEQPETQQSIMEQNGTNNSKMEQKITCPICSKAQNHKK